MKKFILIVLIFFTITTIFSQGIRKKDGIKIGSDIPSYNLASGDTEWVIGLEYGEDCSFRWDIQIDITGLTGVFDGTLAIYKSSNSAISWLPYPNLTTKTITSNGSYGWDDPDGTTYDAIKAVLTVNGITGGNLNMNQRIVTIPNKQ